MTMGVKWSKKFPAPEGSPSADPPDQPVRPNTGSSQSEMDAYYSANESWRKLVSVRNDWIIARRKNSIAVAVDNLIDKSLIDGFLTPAEHIAMILGMSWLEGTLTSADDIFGRLFGGLL